MGMVAVNIEEAKTGEAKMRDKKTADWPFFFGADTASINYSLQGADYRLWVKVRVTTSRCCSGVRALKRTA